MGTVATPAGCRECDNGSGAEEREETVPDCSPRRFSSALNEKLMTVKAHRHTHRREVV